MEVGPSNPLGSTSGHQGQLTNSVSDLSASDEDEEVEDREKNPEDLNPWPFLKDFFQLVSATRMNHHDNKVHLTFKCKLCPSTKKKNRHQTNSTSRGNLEKHIQACHQLYVGQFRKLLQQHSKRKLKSDRPSLALTSSQEQDSQPSVASFFKGGGGKGWVTQASVDKAIVKFVVESSQPFHIVEEESFIHLVRKKG